MNGIFSGLRKDPEKRIRVAYRLALFAMVALLGTSYFALNSAMDRGRLYAVKFKDINNERMLSQRIVLLSQHALHMEDLPHRNKVLKLVDNTLIELERIHTQLTRQINDQREKNKASRRVHAVFFSWPAHLDYQIRSLITNARQFTKFAAESPDIAAIYLGPMEEIAASKVLPAMDEVTDIYRQQTRNSISLFEHIHLAILILSLILLGVIGQLLFRPLAKQIGQRTRDLVAARDEMQYAATHDGLTGLANRDYAIDALQEEVRRQRDNSDVSMAILLLDLDDFKNVNDNFGHLSGDKLLRSVADRLKSVLGGDGVACRMGGDEFLVIIKKEAALGTLSTVASKILERLNSPVLLAGVSTQVRTSIGIARFPTDGDDAEDLLAAADLSLYAAKKSGKGTFRFFNEDLQKQLNDAKVFERDIDRAITEGQFKPVFQPQISTETGAITGVEVLTRWHHPERGVLLPAEFLGAAANLGRMPDITRLVLDQAFGAAAEWQSNGIDFGRIGVNFSAHDLMWNGFFRSIAQTAGQHGLSCDRISVEVVESVAIDSDNEQSAQALYELRQLGIQIEVDDFGTGFASLSHLNRDLFDRVKIDRQFVSGIDDCERIRIIVDSIIRLASALNIKVIAEGVESQEEIDTLIQLGCSEFQGNAIAPPMPADVARDWLAAYNRNGHTAIDLEADAG
ncbi:putative bifunctional diguanylate cyclase/phosphodiesterase [Hoeflea sp. TYP-13]|uniref:putative bifunctional diguanylate cyclase/phosphodiesterase n=1 Tax=Hoeflea sp. TYP-13 TaxID=3230023 RepID=UPI0034C6D854